MPNQFAISDLAIEAMEEGLFANTKLTKTVDTSYSEDFEKEDLNSGDTIRVTLPPRKYGMTAGKNLSASFTDKEIVSVTVQQYNAGDTISSAEMKLEDRKFVSRVLKPRVQSCSRFVEKTGFDALAENASMLHGLASANPSNFRVWAEAQAKMRQMLVPSESGIYGAMDHLTMAAFSDNEKKLFSPKDEIEGMWRKGEIQEAANIKFYTSSNLNRHTNGDGLCIGPQLSATPSAGNTVTIDGVSSGSTYTAGSKFKIVGVNAVDPESKAAMSWPMWFTLTEDAAVIGAATTLTFAPALVLTGSLQNVSTALLNNDEIEFYGLESTAYIKNLLYDKNAIIMVGLKLPDHDNDSGRVSMKTFREVPIRTVNFTDWMGDQNYLRFDIMFGWAVKRFMHVFEIWQPA